MAQRTPGQALRRTADTAAAELIGWLAVALLIIAALLPGDTAWRKALTLLGDD